MAPLSVRSAITFPEAGSQRDAAVLSERKPSRKGFIAAVVFAAVVATAAASIHWLRITMLDSIPAPPLPASGLFAAPVLLTVSISGQQAPWVTTEQEVRESDQLWRRMHLEDWNAVPATVRAAGLDNLLQRYAGVLNTPQVWDRMSAFDWDDIPQPVRTVAYRRMVAYWSGFYGVGAELDLPPGAVAETLAAIVMSESWFNHRAASANRDGGWDVGLAQASPYARARLRQLHARGVVDAALTEADYLNPWMATRFVALWMKLMLNESGGDLERAIRAYNRGSADAMDRHGADYLAAVQRRLTRFIRNSDAPASWDYVWVRSRQIVAAHSVFPPAS